MFERRDALKKLGLAAAAGTTATFLSGCGAGDELEGDASEDLSRGGRNSSSAMRIFSDFERMSAYYANSPRSYVSDRQGGGRNYGTKVYANPVTVGQTTQAGQDTTGPLTVIRGLYLDAADRGHNPRVSVSQVGSSTVFQLSVAHSLQAVSQKNAGHGITAIDLWVPGGTTPLKTKAFEAAQAGSPNSPVSVNIPVVGTDLSGYQEVYFVTHCNNHGGRIVIAAL